MPGWFEVGRSYKRKNGRWLGLKVESSVLVEAPLEDLVDWWMDFSDDDHQFTKHVLGLRTISRSGSELVLEDDFIRPRKLKARVKVNPESRKVSFDSDAGRWRASGTFSFSSGPEGTKATLDIGVTPKGRGRLLFLLPLYRRRVRDFYLLDFADHLDEFQSERFSLSPSV